MIHFSYLRIMSVLITPVNFSTSSNNAARYAADLAKAMKADLLLVHVIEIPMTTAELLLTDALYETMAQSANDALKELQVELQTRTGHNTKIEIRMEVGGVTAKMKEISEEIQPYIILLGTSAPSLGKYLAGSPVASLLHKLNFPVLVVPETAAFHPYRHILLAFDLEDINSGTPLSLPLLKDLRDHFGSRFDIVTVETGAPLSDEQKTLQRENWKHQLKDIDPEIHYVRKSQVEEGIQEYLNTNEADLALVFPKKHSFFEFHTSQSGKVAKHSSIPVISLHG